MTQTQESDAFDDAVAQAFQAWRQRHFEPGDSRPDVCLDNIVEMQPIQAFAGGVLAQIVRRQPPSAGRTTFAWQLAVGPALARVTSVEMDGTTLRVRSADPRWLKEIDRAKAVIIPKLQQLLGKDTVTKIRTEK